jgi:hypothetical protein
MPDTNDAFVNRLFQRLKPSIHRTIVGVLTEPIAWPDEPEPPSAYDQAEAEAMAEAVSGVVAAAVLHGLAEEVRKP